MGRRCRALARALKASGLSFSGRRKFWQLFTAHAIRNPDSEPAQNDFDRFVAEVQGLGAAVENGSVTLVGAGPGDPELLTLRAVRALQSADVILFDDLVSRDVLDFARREARKMLVGKTGFGPSCKQDDINALMVSLAKQGKRVVRLKGGDPLIFGRAAEEIAACQGRQYRGRRRARHHRGAGRGEPARHPAHRPQSCPPAAIRHRPRHDGALPEDLDWQSLADPATTTAIYMPVAHAGRAGREGHRRRARSADAGARHRPRHAADQAVVSAPIRELPARLAQAALPGPVLVMLGRVFGEYAGAKSSAPRADQKAG